MNPRSESRDGITWIHLDDGKANAMRTDGLQALGEMLDRAETEHARAIVIRGRDGMFSGGLDVKWLPSLDAAGMRALVDTFSTTMLRVLASPIPTVALVSGHAIAGGCMLACACDVRIGVAGGYRMQMNEVAVRIPMPSWATLIARSAIPAPQVYDVLQRSVPLGFERAEALGTLHEIARDFEDLDARGQAAAVLAGLLDAKAFAATKQRLWADEVAHALQQLVHE